MKHTPWNSEGGGDVVYLDRHNLDCGNSHTINYFHLVRNGDGNYRFDYRCCNTPYSCRDVWKSTPYNRWGGRGMVYLDRHVVSCGTQYMSSVWLRRSGDRIWYSYRCCEMTHRRSCYSGHTAWSYDGGGSDGNTVYLDRQHLSCYTGYGLTHFHLQRNGGHDHVRYHYTCCKAN